VLAAGAVCWRETEPGAVEVVLIHRTQHKDVSLPKGKVDPGETLPETAVREIAEETGLVIGLGAPLGTVSYRLPSGRDKVVHYWAAEVGPLAIARSTFEANDEVEEIHWVPLESARERLSYPHDSDVLDRFEELYRSGRARTFSVIALRHGKALPASSWDGPDATRPLLQLGNDQAANVAPGIAAFRPAKLISSPAERCLRTIAPTSWITDLPVAEKPAISQDAYRSAGKAVGKVVAKRLRRRVNAVLCSHGPVLPQIVSSLAEQAGTSPRDPAWAPQLDRASSLSVGEFAVLHLALDAAEPSLVAVEVHSPAL